MQQSKYLFVSAMLAAATQATPDVPFMSIGEFKLKNAAFPSLGAFGVHSSDIFLMCSSFGVIGDGHIYMVPGVHDAVSNGDASTL